MHLPDNLRDKLKKPLGVLLKDSEVTKEHILKYIPAESFVITVGLVFTVMVMAVVSEHPAGVTPTI